MDVEQIIRELKARVAQKDPAQLAQSAGIYQFHLTGEGGGDWALAVSGTGIDVMPGQQDNPGVTVTISAADFKELATGRMNPMAAFMSGKLAVTGSMGLAMKLTGLIT